MIQSILADLEAERKFIARHLLYCYGCLVLAFPLALLAMFNENFRVILIGATGIVLVSAFIIYYNISSRKEEYIHHFKLNIIKAALMQVHPSLRIEPGNGFSESEFVDCGMFDEEPDRFNSEDQVTGRIGNTVFCFSEVHAEQKVKHGKNESWTDIFKGIIFVADFNKNFDGVTIVRAKDAGESLTAWFARNVPVLIPDSKSLVQLENPDFCREFVTYSSDQVEARYILTPALMDRLCELNSRSAYTISASFLGRYMYLAFPLSGNHFEPPIFKTLLDDDLLEGDMELIRFMTRIIEDLDLNTRIWGKA